MLLKTSLELSVFDICLPPFEKSFRMVVRVNGKIVISRRVATPHEAQQRFFEYIRSLPSFPLRAEEKDI